MRIISGSLKGHPLKAPKGMSTRPVLDQVKEAIFNILPSPEGLCILDVFAGTGALGIEALSRGAKEAAFIEKESESTSVLLENLKRCRLNERAHVIAKPLEPACRLLRKKKRQFDWIFCDPPYDKGLIARALDNPDFLTLAHSETILIIEHSPRERPDSEHWTATNTRRYGQTYISFLRKVEQSKLIIETTTLEEE